MERAKATACKSNMRQLGLAIISFAGDHEGRLPGAYANSANPDVRGGGPFVGKEVLIPEANYTLWLNDPDTVGSLSEYLTIGEGDARRYYRCPALKFTGLDTGVGSNGMFDYKYVKAFAGVPLHRIPTTSILDHDWVMYTLPTPIIFEEDPREHGNNYYIDPGFSNADRIGTWHPKLTGHYIAIDGSVHAFMSKRNHEGPRCFSWRAGGDPENFHGSGTPFWDSNISYGQWHVGM
ncbi:MAG: hypothetical protein PF795_06240, partial [Kiritimatiellae bacterium]|jgi:hypothetical protein|nr:hypothetical protein [Kiritimatiellia bacterium]